MDIESRKKDLANWKKTLKSLPEDAPDDIVEAEKRRYANTIRFAISRGDDVWQRFYDPTSNKMLDKKIKVLEGIYLGKLGKKDLDLINSVLEKLPKGEEIAII